ncbi:MAG: hypothetical protein R3E61_07915 [Pseudomonadales bacterium]
MQLTINVPIKADIVNGGFVVSVAGDNTTWNKSQLGHYADKSGVYIHHTNGKIIYIGKATTGNWGNFGERLRREFQKSASSNSNLYQLLAAQTHPIKTYLLDLEDIDMMVNPGPMQLSPVRKALIMEQTLIGLYEPEGNRV